MHFLAYFFLSLMLFIVLVIFIVAGTRKGSVWINKKPGRIETIISEKSPDEVFKKLVKFGQGGTYKVEAVDETKKVIVFGEGISMLALSFFYPVYISADQNNKTLIEAGIVPKVLELPPVVSKSHESFINNLKISLIDTE